MDHHQLSLSIYSSPLLYKLDSLTLTFIRWFTNGMFIKLKNRLQTYIIKYILSQKLEKYINANTDRLFITTDTYSALMDIRERLKGEIAQYESEQKRLSNPLIQKRIRDEKERWAKKLKEWFF